MRTEPHSSSTQQHTLIRRLCTGVIWQECARLFGFDDYTELSEQQASDWINLMKGKARIVVTKTMLYFESPRVQLITNEIKKRIPMHHRQWNPERGCWAVRSQHFEVLCEIAARFRYAEVVKDGAIENLKAKAETV